MIFCLCLGLGGLGLGPGLGPPRSRFSSVLTSVSLDHGCAYLKEINISTSINKKKFLLKNQAGLNSPSQNAG